MDLQTYTPHANQIRVHECKARYRVAVCGRRWGKSAMLLNEAIARAMQLEKQICWIILPMYRQAKEIYWIDPDITKYFMPYVMEGLIKKNEQELSLYVKHTESWIRLKGGDNYDSLRGSGIDFLGYDEVGDMKEKTFETISPALADSPNHRVLSVGTPKGLGYFHDLALRGDHINQIPAFGKPVKKDEDYQTFHFTSYDNLTWGKESYERDMFVKHIDREKSEYDEKGRLAFFNQEYMASFEESAGRFFPRWNFKTHVLDRISLPDVKFKRFGTMDWGRSAPFAWYSHVIMPINYEGLEFDRVITFREEYSTDKSPYEQAADIANKIDYRTISNTIVDPQMFDLGLDKSQPIVSQFQAGFRSIYKDKPYVQFTRGSKNVIGGCAAVDNWMRLAPDGLPYWMITQDCPNLIRTIPLMEPDELNIEKYNTKLEDHALDSIRYGLHWMKWVDPGLQLGSVDRRAFTDSERRRLAAPQSLMVDKYNDLLSIDPDEFIDDGEVASPMTMSDKLLYKK